MGGIRNQFHHVIDVVPTILQAAHIQQPKIVEGIPQKPIVGVSMVYTFDKKNEGAPSTHVTQYFEMMGDRAIYHDGWIASTKVMRVPWDNKTTTANVLDYPVMIRSTLGAPFGGTTRAGQYGFESLASRSILPPNFCGGGGSWSPGIVIVAAGSRGEVGSMASVARTRPNSSGEDLQGRILARQKSIDE